MQVLAVLQVLRESFPGDGQALAVEQAFAHQVLEHSGGATDGVEVGHDVLATGLQVRDERHVVGDLLEVFQRELDAGSLSGRFDSGLIRFDSGLIRV